MSGLIWAAVEPRSRKDMRLVHLQKMRRTGRRVPHSSYPVIRENPKLPRMRAPTLRAKSCLSWQDCTSTAYASITDYFSAKALDPRRDTNSREFSLRMQSMKITQPADGRDVNRSTRELLQACHPRASVQPIMDQDPVSRSTLDARGRGCTSR
jgi:hypothetical protein